MKAKGTDNNRIACQPLIHFFFLIVKASFARVWLPQGILCFGAQIGVEQLFNSFLRCLWSSVRNLFCKVKKTSR